VWARHVLHLVDRQATAGNTRPTRRARNERLETERHRHLLGVAPARGHHRERHEHGGDETKVADVERLAVAQRDLGLSALPDPAAFVSGR
jgi:hypothetical protein